MIMQFFNFIKKKAWKQSLSLIKLLNESYWTTVHVKIRMPIKTTLDFKGFWGLEITYICTIIYETSLNMLNSY